MRLSACSAHSGPVPARPGWTDNQLAIQSSIILWRATPAAAPFARPKSGPVGYLHARRRPHGGPQAAVCAHLLWRGWWEALMAMSAQKRPLKTVNETLRFAARLRLAGRPSLSNRPANAPSCPISFGASARCSLAQAPACAGIQRRRRICRRTPMTSGRPGGISCESPRVWIRSTALPHDSSPPGVCTSRPWSWSWGVDKPTRSCFFAAGKRGSCAVAAPSRNAPRCPTGGRECVSNGGGFWGAAARAKSAHKLPSVATALSR